MPVWLRRWSTASCTMARSSTSKDRHGGSKAVQSTTIWCHRQLPPPTAPKLPSTHSTALVDRRTRCVERIVVDVIPVDGHHVPMPTRQENTNTSATTSDLSTDARPETLWGNDALLAQGLHKPAACTHSPRATTTRSLRSLSTIQRPTIPVGPTLAPLYQFYPRLTPTRLSHFYPGIHTRRLTRVAMPNSVFATCQLSPLGRAATSRRSLETSIPTNTSVIRLVLRGQTSLGPVLQIRARVAQATVRAAREQDEMTELRHGLEWDQSPAACLALSASHGL